VTLSRAPHERGAQGEGPDLVPHAFLVLAGDDQGLGGDQPGVQHAVSPLFDLPARKSVDKFRFFRAGMLASHDDPPGLTAGASAMDVAPADADRSAC
jgi:hypothetical protein